MQTGLVSPRFIHNKYSKPWLVKSFFLQRHSREALGAQNTNSAYAISLSSESSVKRKLKTKPNKSSNPGTSVYTESNLENKKLKIDSSDNDRYVILDESTDLSSISNEESLPPRKKMKLDENNLGNEPMTVDETHCDETSVESATSLTVKDADNSVSSTEDLSESSEQNFRVLIKTASRKWVPVPNENYKKFSGFDPS